jgi:hypothetical protein
VVCMDSVYGYVFMAMCMDVGLWVCMDVFLDVWMCFWLCVYGYGYVFVAMCMDIGSRSSARPGSSISGLTSPWGPFPLPLGLTLPRGPFQQLLGLTPPRGPFQHNPFHNPWDLLLHEAHLDDSSNFSNFSSTKMEKFAPVCSVE